MDSEFLTAEEVAEYLRLPLSTVYKLVQDKRLPGLKLENIGVPQRDVWAMDKNTRAIPFEKGEKNEICN